MMQQKRDQVLRKQNLNLNGHRALPTVQASLLQEAKKVQNYLLNGIQVCILLMELL
jgi:hypothetical protein